MRLSGITKESIVDGPGIRLVLFTQGCPHACQHCHNPDSWHFDGGMEYPLRQILRMLRQAKWRNQLKGITFSGGEPFAQAGELAQVAGEAHRIGWDVCTYTGYTYETLAYQPDEQTQCLLNATDYLIDGLYIHERRNISLRFRGSENQRMIDLAATRKYGSMVLGG